MLYAYRMDDPEFASERMLLRLSLELSVPLWIHKLRGQPTSVLERVARDCGAVLSERGDTLMFRARRKERGRTADTFNRVAKGIACASLVMRRDWHDLLDLLWCDPSAYRYRPCKK